MGEIERERTFSAISTAPQNAAISVVRLSGERAIEIADSVFQPLKKGKEGPLNSGDNKRNEIEKSQRRLSVHTEERVLSKRDDQESEWDHLTAPTENFCLKYASSHTLTYGAVIGRDGEVIDRVLAAVLRAPHTYTGLDTVELYCHGGTVVTAMVLDRLIEAGAAPAEAGEFTKTAFLNGKLDLAEAESVIDLIHAGSARAARNAAAGVTGSISKEIDALEGRITALLSHILAYVDFADEGLVRLPEEELLEHIRAILDDIERLCATYPLGRAIKEGVGTVICGRPNAGKSSVMNLLSGYERSIVTELAGTTRDVITNTVELKGVRFLLSDTAGLRETGDTVERLGVDRARQEIACADLLICVFDGSVPMTHEDYELLEATKGCPAVAVINKSDLPESGQLYADGAFSAVENQLPTIRMSAKTGENLHCFQEKLCAAAGVSDYNGVVVDNLRHRDCLLRACESLRRAEEALSAGFSTDLAEIDLTDAAGALAEITGHSVGEEVVAGIFSRFCVGK